MSRPVCALLAAAAGKGRNGDRHRLDLAAGDVEMEVGAGRKREHDQRHGGERQPPKAIFRHAGDGGHPGAGYRSRGLGFPAFAGLTLGQHPLFLSNATARS